MKLGNQKKRCLRRKFIKMKESKTLNVLGVYAGCGSPLIGFNRQGHNIIGNIEPREFVDPRTFTTNFSNHGFYPKLEYVPDLKPDIIVGSPSCNVFSLLSTRKDHKVDESITDTDFFKACLLIERYSPEVVILENVPRILKHLTIREKGIFFNSHPNRVLLADYYVQLEKLNSWDFNTPQKRNRAFFIFKKKPVEIPIMLGQMKLTVGEAFEDLSEDKPNQEMPRHSQERIEGFKNLEIGESYYGTQNNKRLDPEKPSGVITSHCSRFVHPIEPRTLTVRESARLMGYPDDFIFYGTSTKQLDQVGKAIAPRIILGLLPGLEEYFNGSL